MTATVNAMLNTSVSILLIATSAFYVDRVQTARKANKLRHGGDLKEYSPATPRLFQLMLRNCTIVYANSKHTPVVLDDITFAMIDLKFSEYSAKIG